MRSIDDAFLDVDSHHDKSLQETNKRRLKYDAIEDYVEKETALLYSNDSQKANLRATMEYIKTKFNLEDYQIERYKYNKMYARNNYAK